MENDLCYNCIQLPPVMSNSVMPSINSLLIGTPWVSCRFADVHAKTRKCRAEVGQNIITVDSALFKFTVAKIRNSDFYSK